MAAIIAETAGPAFTAGFEANVADFFTTFELASDGDALYFEHIVRLGSRFQ